MKTIYVIWFLAVLLLIPYSNTMGAMTRGAAGGPGSQQEMGSGMMGGQQGHAGQGSGMMRGHEVAGGMMQNMNRMAGLMQEMKRIMEKHADEKSMKKMSTILQDMSEHMKDMSRIMKKGIASQEEMYILNKQMLETQKKFEMMQVW